MGQVGGSARPSVRRWGEGSSARGNGMCKGQGTVRRLALVEQVAWAGGRAEVREGLGAERGCSSFGKDALGCHGGRSRGQESSGGRQCQRPGVGAVWGVGGGEQQWVAPSWAAWEWSLQEGLAYPKCRHPLLGTHCAPSYGPGACRTSDIDQAWPQGSTKGTAKPPSDVPHS